MMNYASDAAAEPWCCYNNAGEAAEVVPTSGETGSFFADMVADYSTDDLFELAWEQGQYSSKPPDVRFDPPLEDEMAAWLGAIVKGDVQACADNDGDRRPMMADDGRDVVPPTMGTLTATDKQENIPTTMEKGTIIMGNKKEIRKAPAGESSRSHHGEAHNLTEKRRRHKINERLKTLQQLVPGCSKSNQASTLDQTINYMKSLQHQVQAMSVGLAVPAVYPVVQPRCVPPGTPPVAMPFPAAPMVLGGHPPSTMVVPLGTTTMLQLPHCPATAVVVPAAAAVAPLYPAPAAAPPTSTAAVAPGYAMSVNRFHGSTEKAAAKEKAVAASLCVPQ